MKKLWSNKKIVIIAAVVALIAGAAYYVSDNYFQLMLIQGESMEPTYDNMSLVVVDKRDKGYAEGDVIAFRCKGVKGVLVKRIVAAPTDELIIKDGSLYVNGVLSAHLLEAGTIDYAGIAKETICLGEDEYFVLGDNYRDSRDSRYDEVGIITTDEIIGKIK